MSAVATAYEAGQTVKFVGFDISESSDMPDNGELLEEGKTYVIDSIVEDDDNDTVYRLTVDNPNFDSSKRPSKKTNPKVILVEAYEDEVEAAPVEEVKPAAKTRRTTKKAAATETETEAKPAAKKATAKKTTAKKSTTAAKTPAKGKAKAVTKADDKAEQSNVPTHLQGIDFTILEESEEDSEILELVASTENLCDLAQELAQESHSMEFRLGGVIYHVRKTGSYRDLDASYAENKGFEAYCENELGIGYRKAMYLCKIYQSFCKAGLNHDHFSQIGWSKAKELVGVITSDNAEELITLAGDSTVIDLTETIKESYKDVTPGQEKKVVKKITFKFRLTEDEAETVSQFLEMAKSELDKSSLDEAFMHIVEEWASEHLEVSKTRRKSRKASK